MSLLTQNRNEKGMSDRACVNCNSTKTHVDKKGYAYWRKGLCQMCYDLLIHRPKWAHIHNRRRIKPRGGKPISLKENPRRGKCEKCGRKVGDSYIDYFGNEKIVKGTDMHHIQYHEDDPLKDTIELCDSCHNRERYN